MTTLYFDLGQPMKMRFAMGVIKSFPRYFSYEVNEDIYGTVDGNFSLTSLNISSTLLYQARSVFLVRDGVAYYVKNRFGHRRKSVPLSGFQLAQILKSTPYHDVL
jgi:hypothetical protein